VFQPLGDDPHVVMEDEDATEVLFYVVTNGRADWAMRSRVRSR